MSALSGITVLDLSRRYPGAYTSMFLGDFGADVIKIDPPKAVVPAVIAELDTEKFAAHWAPDRNKRSIILDLKKDEARAVFYRLVRRADVLVECFRPQATKRLGADYETLKEINSRLIYCSLTGYGHDGPYANVPGHDMNYIAMSGALSLIGPRNGPPFLPSNFLADMAGAGLHGVIGILLALQARDRTGRGQFVDVSFVDGVMSLMVGDISRYFASGIAPRRGETAENGGSPWANVYKCKDGEYVALGCGETHFWENLCQAIGKKHLIPRQNPPPEELDGVVSELANVFISRNRDEWAEFFKNTETCVSPVYYLNESVSNPQVLHRKMVVELDHPKLGKVRQMGIPIKLSDTPGRVSTLGAPSGTHSDEVLSDLGYGKNEIEKLRSSGAVG